MVSIVMLLTWLYVDWQEIPRCCVISSSCAPPPSQLSQQGLTDLRKHTVLVLMRQLNASVITRGITKYRNVMTNLGALNSIHINNDIKI